MMRRFLTVGLLFLITITSRAQEQKSDTVIVSLARTSKVVFTMQDRSDLEILRHYNFQELFHDILTRIESADSTRDNTNAGQPLTRVEPDNNDDWKRDNNNNEENDEEWNRKVQTRRSRSGRSWQSTNFDLGTNNYLENNSFPDRDSAYAVRPWGSWYFAASSTQRTRIGKNFFLEFGLGLSWYNFKFESDDILVTKNDDGVDFVHDPRDLNFRKSKLSATYVHASLVPVIDFNDRNRKPRMWDGYGDAFRIGVGPYVAYRIASGSKMVYTEDGDRERERDRDSFHLNNLRYGARLQLGFRNTDLFFNYDMSELFVEGKGPKLNAFSFGVIF